MRNVWTKIRAGLRGKKTTKLIQDRNSNPVGKENTALCAKALKSDLLFRAQICSPARRPVSCCVNKHLQVIVSGKPSQSKEATGAGAKQSSAPQLQAFFFFFS